MSAQYTVPDTNSQPLEHESPPITTRLMTTFAALITL